MKPEKCILLSTIVDPFPLRGGPAQVSFDNATRQHLFAVVRNGLRLDSYNAQPHLMIYPRTDSSEIVFLKLRLDPLTRPATVTCLFLELYQRNKRISRSVNFSFRQRVFPVVLKHFLIPHTVNQAKRNFWPILRCEIPFLSYCIS